MPRIGKSRSRGARPTSPVALAAGLVALAGAGHAVAAAQAPANPHSGHGVAADPSVSSTSPADGGLPGCANSGGPRPAASAPTADASVADFARLLHGTWVRRLTIGGAKVETNSFWYFDMSGPEAGRGQALMIDRVNQGWDGMASVPGGSARGAEEGSSAGAASEAPATTGAYWSVSIRPAPADSASRGHKGVTLALAGEYRGTGAEYPPSGFRFVEAGTFYRGADSYATVKPWRAPPMAAEPVPSAPDADRYTPVDAVLVQVGKPSGGMRAGEPGSPVSDVTAGPTLTFVICQDEIVDRYYKVSSATPTVKGKSLKAAWESSLASGMFKPAPTR